MRSSIKAFSAALILCIGLLSCYNNHNDSGEVGTAQVSGVLPTELDGSTTLGLAAELEVAGGGKYGVDITPGGTLSVFIPGEFTGNHQLTMSFFVPYSGLAATAAGSGGGRLMLGQASMIVYLHSGMNDITFDFSTFELLDDDGDGLTNLDELVLGTDPLSKNVVEQYLPYLPSYSGIEIRSMDFTSEDNGWAVGYNDMAVLVLHHQSGIWKPVEVPVTGNDPGLNSVHFTSADEGWAVGRTSWNLSASQNQGLILHYHSGQWTQVAAPDVGSTRWFLYSVFFTSADEGWAVGDDWTNFNGIMLHYVSGTWSKVDISGLGVSNISLRSVYFTGPDDGWAVGAGDQYDVSQGDDVYCGLILHYTGGTWSVASSVDDMQDIWELDAVQFSGADEGWASGYDYYDQVGPAMFHYSQGAWSREDLSSLDLHDDNGISLVSLSFPTADEGWAVGQGIEELFDGFYPLGLLLHYQNGTWSQVTTPYIQGNMTDSEYGWWYPAAMYFNTVCFPSQQKGWIGGVIVQKDLILEFNAGKWSVSSPMINSDSSMLFGLSFPTASEGWAVGWNLTLQRELVLHYRDGAWENEVLPSDVDAFRASGVQFLTSDLGWIIGNRETGEYDNSGIILHHDSGLWSEDPATLVGSTNWFLWSVSFPAADQGWAVGSRWHGDYMDAGIILKYDSGSWSSVTPPATGSTAWSLADVKFPSLDQGWAVGFQSASGQSSSGQEPGDRGILLHYDSGVWSDASSTLPAMGPGWGLYRLNFLSVDEGWASGMQCQDYWADCSGLVLHYQNGTWTAETMPAVPGGDWSLSAVAFMTPDEGWAVGARDYNTLSQQLLVLHYSGGQWQVDNDVVMAPRPNQVRMSSAICPDQDNCWFAGTDQYPGVGTGFILKY